MLHNFGFCLPLLSPPPPPLQHCCACGHAIHHCRAGGEGLIKYLTLIIFLNPSRSRGPRAHISSLSKERFILHDWAVEREVWSAQPDSFIWSRLDCKEGLGQNEALCYCVYACVCVSACFYLAVNVDPVGIFAGAELQAVIHRQGVIQRLSLAAVISWQGEEGKKEERKGMERRRERGMIITACASIKKRSAGRGRRKKRRRRRKKITRRLAATSVNEHNITRPPRPSSSRSLAAWSFLATRRSCISLLMRRIFPPVRGT